MYTVFTITKVRAKPTNFGLSENKSGCGQLSGFEKGSWFSEHETSRSKDYTDFSSILVRALSDANILLIRG